MAFGKHSIFFFNLSANQHTHTSIYIGKINKMNVKNEHKKKSTLYIYVCICIMCVKFKKKKIWVKKL